MLNKLIPLTIAFGLMLAGVSAAQGVQQQRPQQQEQPGFPPQEDTTPPDDEELQRYVQVQQQLESIDQETEQKVADALARSELSPERYHELIWAQHNPEESEEMTAQEEEQFEQVHQTIQQLRREGEEKHEQAIQEAGFEVQRFQEISTLISRDPELMKKYQQLRQEMGGASAPKRPPQR